MLFSGFTRRITSRIKTPTLRFQPHLHPAYSTRAEYKNKMSTGFEAERARITELAEAIKQLKTDGKPCDVELKEMLDLKKKVGQSTGKKDSGKGKIQLKTPKVSCRSSSGFNSYNHEFRAVNLIGIEYALRDTRVPSTTALLPPCSENRSSTRSRTFSSSTERARSIPRSSS
jgi:hypothetical protein